MGATLCRNGSSSIEQSRSVTPSDKTRQSSVLVSPSPKSEVVILASALVASIHTSVDDRFNLVSTYGPFLQYLPSRLGLNKALDAAAAVLIDAHSCICTRSNVTLPTIRKYSLALAELRTVSSLLKSAHLSRYLGHPLTVDYTYE